MSTTDDITSTCLENPLNEKNGSANGKKHPGYQQKEKPENEEDNCNEITNRNNNNNENKDNFLGDSTVNKLNGYFLTKKIRYKHLVKVRSFPGVKISCITDHVKQNSREINPFYIQAQTI